MATLFERGKSSKEASQFCAWCSPILHLPQPGPDSLKEPRLGFARFYIVIIKVKSFTFGSYFWLLSCAFLDLFLASIWAREFYGNKYIIEEWVLFPVRNLREHTLFCLVIKSGPDAFSCGPFETSMAASKLRRAHFGHLRIDFWRLQCRTFPLHPH